MKKTLRPALRWVHLWLGITAGLFICLMGVTGTIVTFRPQITNFLSPATTSADGCSATTDWNAAEKQVETSMGAKINRLYFWDSDPRAQIRIEGAEEKIYRHVTYDVCSAKVLGETNLGWMYWMVDLHHNLLADKAGRWWAGVIGVILLVSAVGGLALWLLANPSIARIFHVQMGRSSYRTSMDLHRSVGLIVMPLLILPAFTGIWLCYQQPLRLALSMFLPVWADTRVPRPKGDPPATLAGLGDIMEAARKALPDATIREIRMPEGYGNVQVRMWREGDFRSLGNNVVTVDSASAHVVAVDLYTDKPSGNRFIQAMAGLHYGEWGGIGFRSIYGIAGLATLLLFITGFLIWWLPKRRKATKSNRVYPESAPSSAPLVN